jgi:UDP-N-acetylmuramyl pentapeptide phosphotransferase/UDP-N-acetylglucosamine-1-phosphate transferase
MKGRHKNNDGLSITQKLLVQVLIALVFFYIYMKGGGDANVTISSLGISIDLGWVYGLFILFLLVGSSNAVNLTDGLDGLAGGTTLIAFLSFGIITWGTTWIEGYQEIAIFCFILVGSLLGFLMYNSHPAKVFMGDTGSLALGATLAAIAILTKHELSLAVIGGVFVVEALSSIIQLTAIKKFNSTKNNCAQQLIPRLRDTNLGNASTDALGIITSLGVLGGALANTENNEEKKSTFINLGIPLLTTLATTIYGTAKSFSGLLSIGFGLATGEIFSLVAEKADKLISKKNDNKA